MVVSKWLVIEQEGKRGRSISSQIILNRESERRHGAPHKQDGGQKSTKKMETMGMSELG